MPGFSIDTSGSTNQNVVYADNIDFSGNASPTPKVTANGQLLIGSATTPNIQVGTLTSPNSTVTIGYSSPNITLESNFSTTADRLIANFSNMQANVTGDGTVFQVPFDTIVQQQGPSSYNTSTGVYTFANAGWYWVYVNLGMHNLVSGSNNAYVQLNATSASPLTNYGAPGPVGSPAAGGDYSFQGTYSVYSAAAGNSMYITVSVGGGTKTVGIDEGGRTYLYISQI